MAKLREYTVKIRILSNQDLKVGDKISHDVYRNLGVQQDRVSIKEFELADEKVEQALALEPHLYVVPNLAQKAKNVLEEIQSGKKSKKAKNLIKDEK